MKRTGLLDIKDKIDQIKVSQETRSEGNIGFRNALTLSCLGMCPLKSAFLRYIQLQTRSTTSFRTPAPEPEVREGRNYY